MENQLNCLDCPFHMLCLNFRVGDYIIFAIKIIFWRLLYRIAQRALIMMQHDSQDRAIFLNIWEKREKIRPVTRVIQPKEVTNPKLHQMCDHYSTPVTLPSGKVASHIWQGVITHLARCHHTSGKVSSHLCQCVITCHHL